MIFAFLLIFQLVQYNVEGKHFLVETEDDTLLHTDVNQTGPVLWISYLIHLIVVFYTPPLWPRYDHFSCLMKMKGGLFGRKKQSICGYTAKSVEKGSKCTKPIQSWFSLATNLLYLFLGGNDSELQTVKSFTWTKIFNLDFTRIYPSHPWHFATLQWLRMESR